MTINTASTERPWSDLAIPPGELLAEELAERGLSPGDFAIATALSELALAAIIAGSAPITAEIARELESALGISADLWLNLEADYQATRARLA